MPQSSPPQSYCAYLLRCWREPTAVWRYRLQNVETGESWGFDSLMAATRFLAQRIEGRDWPPEVNDVASQ